MTAKVILILTVYLSFLFFPAESSPSDSLGIKKIGRFTYIIHKVDPGETVYSLSRKYKVSQEDLIRHNPSIRNGLKVGEELKILLKPGEVAVAGKWITYSVKPSETLFSIARNFGVSVDQIRQWNNLTGNNLSVNQQLKIQSSAAEPETNEQSPSGTIHIVNQGETIYSIAKQYNTTTQDIIRWNSLTSDDLKIGQELIVSKEENKEENKEGNEKVVISNQLNIKSPQDSSSVNQPVTSPVNEVKPDRKVVKEGAFQKIVEQGMAEVIDGSESTKKYLAMHRTAPIGTIMQVRNEMNNLTVFVRVIGKLPDTGENQNVSVRISRTAYDRLGALDKRFPVEITYIP